jgi:N-methylhydantoinase A
VKRPNNKTKTAADALLWIAVDSGGTFTDCVWREGGRLRILKVFSSAGDRSQAIAEAVARIGHKGPIGLSHGTTVGTNALLERKGARVAFVTTAGFEETIEIGRQARPKLYDLLFQRTPPLVERGMRFGVAERVSYTGEILQAADRGELARLAAEVHRSGAESIALSTLFSFANPANENAVATVLEELGIPISVSHEILPEFREYERASTVVINAYLQPLMQTYLSNLQARIAQQASKRSRVHIMQSSGGTTALESAIRQPVRTVLSGPAGGIVGATAMGRRSGHSDIITFDMGGTSTDVALVSGDPKPTNEAEIAGFPIRVPVLDIHTVGAGGGSLARFDAGGALRVGPESAGADPGPICYGKGTQPTVTDANLLLGRLQPDRFLGGEFELDLERTRAITSEWLKAQALRMGLQQFAEGVIRVVNANMERALRVVSIERGYDPREFALVAFGGAGGLHACELATGLGIRTVIVPAMPGALSAYGILSSDIIKDYSRTVVWKVEGGLPSRKLEMEFAAMKKKASTEFRQEGWRGKLKYELSADLRYSGQGFELNIPISRKLVPEFHAEHRRRYGYSHSDRTVEIVTLRLRARLKSPSAAQRQERLAPAVASAGRERRSVVFASRTVLTLIIGRSSLEAGKKYEGPAVVTEYSATTVVPSGAAFHLDKASNLIISVLGETTKGRSGKRPTALRPGF